MSRVGAEPVRTFTIGFREQAFDETRYARQVAERYGTDHHELVVEPDAVEVVPKLVRSYGEPYADSSAIPTYYVSELARRHVTVALNGDGGDESFLGYPRYLRCRAWDRQVKLPPALRRSSLALGDALYRRLRNVPVVRAGPHLLRRLGGSAVQTYEPTLVQFRELDKEEGYGAALGEPPRASSLDLLDPYFDESPDAVTGAAWADLHTYLPDDLLVKVDIATMHHSLEGRSPLLDHVLMEWAAGIPAEEKLGEGGLKSLLKDAVRPWLPDGILDRPKMGFGVPVGPWMRTELRELVEDHLRSDRFHQRGLFRPAWVERTIDEHVDGRCDHQTRLWCMIMLELWYREWIDG